MPHTNDADPREVELLLSKAQQVLEGLRRLAPDTSWDKSAQVVVDVLERWANRPKVHGRFTHLPWLAEYPNLELAETGGGCTAWRHPLDRDAYVLITDGEGADPEPSQPDGEWIVGMYRGDEESVTRAHSVDQVKRLFLAALAGRYVVDGVAEDGSYQGDGEGAPFRIFDVVGQQNLPGEYMTRAEAEEVVGLLK